MTKKRIEKPVVQPKPERRAYQRPSIVAERALIQDALATF